MAIYTGTQHAFIHLFVYLFILKIYLFLFIDRFHRKRRDKRGKIFYLLLYFVQWPELTWFMLGTRSFFQIPHVDLNIQELRPSPTALTGHQETVRLAVKQLGQELLSIWSASVTGQRIMMLCHRNGSRTKIIKQESTGEQKYFHKESGLIVKFGMIKRKISLVFITVMKICNKLIPKDRRLVLAHIWMWQVEGFLWGSRLVARDLPWHRFSVHASYRSLCFYKITCF